MASARMRNRSSQPAKGCAGAPRAATTLPVGGWLPSTQISIIGTNLATPGRRIITQVDYVSGQTGPQHLDQPLDRHPFLLQGVPVADGHRPVLERVEVDGDAERRARFVLTAVAPAD